MDPEFVEVESIGVVSFPSRGSSSPVGSAKVLAGVEVESLPSWGSSMGSGASLKKTLRYFSNSALVAASSEPFDKLAQTPSI